MEIANLFLQVWLEDDKEGEDVGGGNHYCPVGSPWWHGIVKEEMRR